MGKGGGSSQPTSTTAYQTNLPEYAKPYVMNMLGAAQNQLFTTTPGTDGKPGEITGFRPYTPYSTDPTKYFAGPSSLQQGVYNEAGQMQTPGAYNAAQGLTGLAAMGQMGAGSQFAQQATNPFAVQQYMSPYMQNVVDVQKANAIRDYQKGIPALRQQAAAAGAFGGSRQAIQESEAQRSLLANLANIQAQGTQNAFQNAQAQQQFGANLGLQGLQGAASSAAQLGQLAGSQQQADLARMGFQQQTGQAQQQYQQNIINQAIQDYATAQQYPYMQLSTMSNLLRGLPMQSMSTQQYQAQAPIGQQAAGLLGAYGAYKGAFADGGEVKGYNVGGLPDADESLKAKMEKMAKANPEGLAKLVASSTSKEVKDMGKEVLSGIARGNTGGLMTNMAGGGIIAFAEGGDTKYYGDPEKNPNENQLVELTEEEKKALQDNPYLQRSRNVKEALAPLGQLKNYDPVQKLAELGGNIRSSWNRFITESDADQAKKFRSYSNRKEQAANPNEYVPAVKTATQREDAAKAADAKELADAAGQSSKIDYNKAAQYLKDAKGDVKAAARDAGAGDGAGGAGGRSPYGLGATMTGIGDAFKQVQGLLGTDKPNEQLQAYEDLIAGKQKGLGLRGEQMDRKIGRAHV